MMATGKKNTEDLLLEITELKKQLQESNDALKLYQSYKFDLEESNRRIKSMINNLNGAVYRCKNDKDWTMEFASDGIYELTGYPSSDFIDNRVRTYNSIIHKDDQERLWNNWQQIINENKSFTDEYRIIHSDGTERWVWERGNGIFVDGELVALEGFISDITVQKSAMLNLKSQEELLELMGRMAKIGGWEFDVNTFEGDWTEEVARIHDMSPDEPIDAHLGLTFFKDKYRDEIEQALDDAINKGKPFDLELELVSKKGIKKWIRTKGVPIYEDGKIVRIKGIFHDITVRKKALLSLEDERIRLKTLIETIPDMIWLKDPDGIYLTCNPRFERFFGHPEEEIIGKTDYDFLDKEFADFFRQKDKEAIAANQPTMNMEWIRYADDGHEEYLQTIKTPMYDSMGKLIGVLGIARDKTEEYFYEQRLKEKDLIFKSLLDKSPIYIYFKDYNYRILYLSKNYEDLLGKKVEEMIGQNAYDLFSPEYAHAIMLQDKLVLEEKRSLTEEIEINGRFYTNMKFPIQRENGETILAGYSIDITEIKKAEQDLLQAKEKAEESDRLKTAFLQNMSHEIRTPMNAIMGFAELLPDVFDDKEQLEYYARIIEQRSSDLLMIINEILDIAKIESGRLVVSEELCNMLNWIESIILFFKEYQNSINKKNIALKFDFEKIECNLIFDQGKTKQILLNLVNNAFKFTENGHITISCKSISKDKLLFSVADSGIGIGQEDQNKVFERFEQLATKTSTTAKSGTGLGLAIVKGMLDAMKGEIWLESEPGKGSTFYFTVPVKVE